ncbi:MAG: hypothetical protein JXQ96_12585 [Cyclobacteriaceae bacterium]
MKLSKNSIKPHFCNAAFVLLILLSACSLSDRYNKTNSGIYWSNTAYHTSTGRSVFLEQNEHLFEISDSLITHSIITDNTIYDFKYKIGYLKSIDQYSIVYYASNVNAAFHLDRRSNSIKVFPGVKTTNNSRCANSVTHISLQKVEKKEPAYLESLASAERRQNSW